MHLRGLIICWTFIIWIRQQLLYRNEYALNVINWAPIVLEDVETYIAVVVNIWMENLCHKLNLRGFVGILIAKVHPQLKHSTFPLCVLRPKYDSSPLEYGIVIRDGCDGLVSCFILNLFEVFHETTFGILMHFWLNK